MTHRESECVRDSIVTDGNSQPQSGRVAKDTEGRGRHRKVSEGKEAVR
jgi:hypothetical protein